MRTTTQLHPYVVIVINYLGMLSVTLEVAILGQPRVGQPQGPCGKRRVLTKFWLNFQIWKVRGLSLEKQTKR